MSGECEKCGEHTLDCICTVHKMNNWIEPKLRLPEQGKYVVCFYNGKVNIRKRLKNFWIPSYIYNFNFDAPQYWQEIEFPDGFDGYSKIPYEGNYITYNELEKISPDLFDMAVDRLISVISSEMTKMMRNEEFNPF